MYRSPCGIHNFWALPQKHERLNRTDLWIRLGHLHDLGHGIGMKFSIIIQEKNVIHAFEKRVFYSNIIPLGKSIILRIRKKGDARQAPARLWNHTLPNHLRASVRRVVIDNNKFKAVLGIL